MIACAFALCSITATAQPQPQVKTPQLSLGDIAWNVPALAKYELKNNGSQPLQITDVRTDCGCTSVNWEKQPIPPGHSTIITLSYDANTLGTFQKSVSITTNASTTPLLLSLKGRVVREVVNYDKDFPVSIGDLRLSSEDLLFDDVNRGEQPQTTLFIFNNGKKDYSPELMHLPTYLKAYAEPETIRPGKIGKMIVTLNSNEVRNFGLTQSSIYLSRFPGDRVGNENELNTSVILLPHFSEAERNSPVAPKADIATSIDLGNFGDAKELKGQLMLTNRGQSPLKVKMLQVYNRGISVSLSKGTIKPGASAKLKVSLSQSTTNIRGSRRILLITNDPQLPKITIEVKAKK